MNRLDLGCGANPTGTVNCDLYINDIGHRTGRSNFKGSKIPTLGVNFVQCDLNQHPLPFETGSFDEVYSRHTIEHLNNPYRFLAEMVRIARYRIIVIFPHGMGERITEPKRNPYHKHWLNRAWIVKAAQTLGCSCSTQITAYSGINLHGLKLFIQFPIEVTAELNKNA